jgi:hypothetical protein
MKKEKYDGKTVSCNLIIQALCGLASDALPVVLAKRAYQLDYKPCAASIKAQRRSNRLNCRLYVEDLMFYV